MLIFKNSELAPVVNFLTDLKLKGKSSRGRTKLVIKLTDKYQEFQKELESLKEEYSLSDTPPIDEPELQEYQQKVAEHNKQFAEILDEEAQCDFSEYNHFLTDLIEGLNNSDSDFSGQDAVIYDVIVEKLEEENKNVNN